MGNRMKALISTLIIISLGASQSASSAPDSSNRSESAVLDTASQQIPSGLDTGYKGFVWGSPSGTAIPTMLTKNESTDSLAVSQTFIGSDFVDYFRYFGIHRRRNYFS
jgi:hypothetical protein